MTQNKPGTETRLPPLEVATMRASITQVLPPDITPRRRGPRGHDRARRPVAHHTPSDGLYGLRTYCSRVPCEI